MKSILVTGSNGVLGKQVVKTLLDAGYSITGIGRKKSSDIQHKLFKYISGDLTQFSTIEKVFKENQFSHVVHLAAIAHVFKGLKISWSKYYRVNTLMSRQIFEYASKSKTPVFFASTVDVYGIQNKIINEQSEPMPLGSYAKSKYLAEKALLEIANQPFLIARFAPIYTEHDQRDIHRRYYIRYPKVCFLIGDGMEYEFLSSQNAASLVLSWVESTEVYKGVINACDPVRHNTNELIKRDKQNGLAHKVLPVPNLLKKLTHISVNIFFYKKPFLKFTAYKIICPMKFDRSNLERFLTTNNKDKYD